ncbi:Transposase (plasmid) [Escherichia coli O25b:H4]|uniref:Transposase n=1 Tax=Escherichia coli O25b:H4 TaxID=941280 RepID=A0A192CMP6_ECO25|nr:Transposase [Escherichia coli O25b:H4]
MNPFKGRHFQRDIILWAVRWYCKYGISYRELQEMLAERGVNVDHSLHDLPLGSALCA